jgi:hypothetical protein
VQFVGVLDAKVDLVLDTVESEANGTRRIAAVDVIDEEGLNLLSHVMLL